ncbi:hypothetical protein ACFXPA_36020 [Amycolatopsis sp. NPDC059090]|uniref:hypothetical protein n=1 Tax=Amycolatopsis sp. NPDC059090 TaxID=3346723 RepID=UPI00367188D7
MIVLAGGWMRRVVLGQRGLSIVPPEPASVIAEGPPSVVAIAVAPRLLLIANPRPDYGDEDRYHRRSGRHRHVVVAAVPAVVRGMAGDRGPGIRVLLHEIPFFTRWGHFGMIF